MFMVPEMQRRRLLFSGHGHLKMSGIGHHSINRKDGVLTYPPPFSPSYSNIHRDSNPSSSSTKISSALLFIIVILAVLFFIAGLLHLFVRFLTKNNTSSSSSSSSRANRNLEASSTSETLQRQLQQLFHLHDSGLDQAFIDALPVFSYKEVVGPKKPFDCAVCLCEFSEADQLRLLPTCSHAFHIKCIDTWLLTNSTCPLCRNTLFNPGFSIENPMFDYDEDEGCPNYRGNGFSMAQKKTEIEEMAGVFPIRLGKFRKLNQAGGNEGDIVGETSSSNLDARRCYSMGSYQYVVGDAKLRVAALSRDKINERDVVNKGGPEGRYDDGKKISIGAKTDSYSVSKIWLWPKKGRFSSENNPNLELPWMRPNTTTEERI